MQKAGGIVALIAGVFAILAAIITLLIGGMSAAFKVEGGTMTMWLGWGGVVFSFLTIVLGAVALSTHHKSVGCMLMVCAVAGAILGGTFVAVFMVLVLIGGILVTIGAKPAPAS